MSGDYLQRLFDRAATAPAFAMPAGASLSPVAEADQRLNDPERAARFGRPDLAAPEAAEAPAPAFHASAAAPPRSLATPRPRPRMLPAVSVAPRLPPPEAPARQGPPTGSTPAPAPRFIPPTVGEVRAEDFVRPETVEPAALESTPAPVAAPPPAAPPPPAATVEPAPPVPRAATLSAGPDRLPSRDSAPQLAATPPDTRLDVAPVTLHLSEPAEHAVPAAARAESPPPTRPAAVEPVPPLLPLLPLPPLPAQPPGIAAAPKAQAAAAPPAPRDAPSPPQTAEPPRITRPMTAAEASIIGPLSPRPRATTLFGLRRR